MKKILVLIVFLSCSLSITAQEALDRTVDLSIFNQPLAEALYTLIDQQGVKLSFRNEILPTNPISIHVVQQPLRDVLNQLLNNTKLSYQLVGSQILIIPKPSPPPSIDYILSGFISDMSSGERLIGASIIDTRSGRGTVSNEYGFFTLSLPAGNVQLSISYIGYQNWDQNIPLQSNQSIQAELLASITLKEVIIYSEDSLNNPIGGMATGNVIGLRETQLLPSLAGEPDVIRTALLLPGVTSGADGAEGLQVRGGDAGQNLVLLDGVPVYYVNHAIGLFSIFNSSAVRSAQLFRGGFPARYSGRLSSILDIRTKEGNDQTLKANVELGLLSSRISMEGPIIKERSSFFLSGRWSFVHAFLRPRSTEFKKEKNQNGVTDYRFYDVNLKFNHSFSLKDRIFLSVYRGKDGYQDITNSMSSNYTGPVLLYDIDQSYEQGINWDNTVSALRWNHIFNNRVFANFSTHYSALDQTSYFDQQDFLHEITFDTRDTFINRGLFESGIEDIGIEADFHFFPNDIKEYRFGLRANQRIFRPGALLLEEDYDGSPFNNNRIYTTEINAYIETQGQWKKNWKYNAGIHLANWSVRKKHHLSVQPRLNIEYRLGQASFLKASGSRMVQYLHLLNNTSAGIPSEIWVPSTEEIAPSAAWMGSLGYRRSIGKQYRLESEVYYKKMDQLLSFKGGVETFREWETNVTQGQGESYGMEFMLSKTKGSLTGWISYTISKSTRQFNDINLGRVYPFKYDRPHDFKAALIYQIAPQFYFSTNWIYSSGFAFTLPLIKFSVGQPGQILPGDFNPEIFTADARNNFRMPAYHRLDANLHYEWNSQDQSLHHKLNIGVYNAYNHNNPLYYDVRFFFTREDFTLTTRFSFVEVQLTPILPSVSYQLSF